MISIVLPAYNEEKYVEESLTSLLNQDYSGEYEVILVDNGSTDRTVEIAQSLGVTVVSCHQKGVLSARRYGASAARGDIIVQADADTVYPVDWLSRLTELFKKNPDAVGIGGRFLYRSPVPRWAFLEYFIRSLLNFMGMVLLRRPVMISGANFAFYRNVFNDVGGYNIDVYSGDQYDIASRLSKRGRIIVDPSLIVHTSSRRIENKPFVRIAFECVVNVLRIIRYFFGISRNSFKYNFENQRSFRMAVLLLPAIIVLGYFAHGYYLPDSQVFGNVYYKGSKDQMKIALTFDDGPNEPYTSGVLDALDSHGIKGTFFLVGANVLTYPDTVKRMAAAGHNIGNHSFSHNANHAVLPGTCPDIRRAQETIMTVAGVQPHFYRPPHGKKSPWQMQCLKEIGLIDITWSVATEDQHVVSAEKLARNIIANAKPGGIILMHDGYGTLHEGSKADKSFTVNALPIIIEELQRQGYIFVTISELLGVPAYN